MPRRRCRRRVGWWPRCWRFFSEREGEEAVRLALDELEALRLADLEGLYQEEAAKRMGVSRATFGRILERARKKVAEALVMGKGIKIEGEEEGVEFKGLGPRHRWRGGK
ncbi:MAG: hypothetical protein DSZ24_05330 [Thermodesulfatator sp.]|nr:MAG: hypothetical protein DSZ24_05330 [Thermodesulfatator sp.]